MEIMKVFSDYYDDERIYSVLMDEDEMYLFSELQKEFAVNKFANAARKFKRNLRIAGEEAKVAFKGAAGKDLNPRDVHTVARNQSLSIRKGKTLYTPEGKISANDPRVLKARDFFRAKAAKGEGAVSSPLFGGYR